MFACPKNALLICHINISDIYTWFYNYADFSDAQFPPHGRLIKISQASLAHPKKQVKNNYGKWLTKWRRLSAMCDA